MSTRIRSRPSGRSYTARLQQRAAAPRSARQWPAWLRQVPAPLALAAELGHLAAAFVEWPASPVRGMVHVLAAAALGLLAVIVYCGPNRLALGSGIVITVALPAGWLAGLYQDFPVAGVLAAVELMVAALLAVRLWKSDD